MKKIIIFGGSGDLSKRKIMPALSKVVQKDTEVYVYARSDLKDVFSSQLREFYNYETDFPEKVTYIMGQYDNISPLVDILNEDSVLYLSLPPQVVPSILAQLSKVNFGIVCIEKPFGNNIEEFRELEKYKDPRIRFIDHYLLKPLMISLYKIQQKNTSLFTLLNNQNIKNVECLFIENILAEGRSYFDNSGIIKDVMQNHLMEMIATIICFKPSDDYSNERLNLIKKMVIDDEIFVFGQYDSYCTEMKNKSNTETFAAAKCFVQTKEWENVPFLLAVGKGLSKKASEVTFNIKKEAFDLFSDFLKSCNSERSNAPLEYIDEMSISFNVAPLCEIYFTLKFKDECIIEPIFINHCYVDKILSETVSTKGDYENIFNSLITNTYFPTISFEEAAELWRLFDPILSANKQLVYYSVGVEKPEEAKSFFEKNK